MGKVAEDKSETVQNLPLACADELAAVEFLEAMRWGEDPCCPHCGDCDTYKMTRRGSEERNARYLWRCRSCGKQYTVRVGTVMEDSAIPLRHWVFAFWGAVAHKKGVSALQIRRQTGLSYKSALFLMHRIRWAMGQDDGSMLTGTVEADETYIGGKRKGKVGRPGRDSHKTPVFAAVERNGRVRAMPVTDVTGATLKGALKGMVHKTARIVTDEYASYHGIGDHFDGGHDVVTHKTGEYARGDVYTNTAEAFFSLLKRGVIGTFHNISRKHLHRYVSEFQFRWDTRSMDDGARLRSAIRAADGRRLTYADQIA